ncbi:MAG: hypothetical protein WC350_05520 [Candidatus Micrarchaeia archaeon]|jgi:hypothetical protein
MAEAVAVMKTLLAANWLKANTDGKVPIFVNAQDDKDTNNATRIDASSQDFIKLYEDSPESRKSNGIGAALTWRESHVTLDIMSAQTKVHAIKVRDEALRVLETTLNTPGTGYQFMEPDISVQNFSGVRDQRLWRWVISVKLVKTNAAHGG